MTLRHSILLSFFCLLAVGSGCYSRSHAQEVEESPIPEPSISAVFSSPDASPSASGSPEASPSPSTALLKISPAEMRQLLGEYTRAQKAEYRALEHRQDMDMKELRASQKSRLSEWKTRMNEARRKFFDEHRGDSKTLQQFMHDRDDKYDAFMKMLDEERRSRDLEAKAKLKSLAADQADRMKEFKSYLGRSERPPRSLWP
jgi:hypothetical protein